MMEENDISQLPVIDDGVHVGSITESAVVHSITGDSIEEIAMMKVHEIMEDAPPMLPLDTDIGVLIYLLEHNPAVLVQEKGKIIGIVTKHDVMKLLHEQHIVHTR